MVWDEAYWREVKGKGGLCILRKKMGWGKKRVSRWKDLVWKGMYWILFLFAFGFESKIFI